MSTRISRVAAFCRENPYTVAIVVVFTVAGMVVGASFPFGELSALRRVVGGGIAGFYFGLLPLGKRLLE